MGCILCKGCGGLEEDEQVKIPQESEKENGILLTSQPNSASVFGLRRRLSTVGKDNKTSKNQQSESRKTDFQQKKSCSWVGGGIPGKAISEELAQSPKFTGAVPGGLKLKADQLWWGGYSRSGNDPLKRRKENQDCFRVDDRLNKDEHQILFTVLDGHGPQGAFASQFVRDRLPVAVSEKLSKLPSNPNLIEMEELFQSAALCVSDELCEDTNSTMDISVSGTTAVCGLIHNSDLYIANVGDSRAVLASVSQNLRSSIYQNRSDSLEGDEKCVDGGENPIAGSQSDGEEKEYMAVELSLDHKPDVASEESRILSCGGRVFEWGTSRVWLADRDSPGLAMSRSFGDTIAQSVGVICEPEVRHITLKEEEASFLILATDGVWEFMSSQEAVDFIVSYRRAHPSTDNPQSACQALVDEAVIRWNEEEEVVDDTTVILIYFTNHPFQ